MSMNKRNLLIVSNDISSVDVFVKALQGDYCVRVISCGELALSFIQSSTNLKLILLDTTISDTEGGFGFFSKLRNNSLCIDVPVIFISDKLSVKHEVESFKLGAVDYMLKYTDSAVIRARIDSHLEKYTQRVKELKNSQLELVNCLSRAAKFKDDDTGMHIVRVSHYCRILSEALNVGSEWSQLLFRVSPIHDIGKIGILDNVLKKNGGLTYDEREYMKLHVDYGLDILGNSNSEVIKMAREVVEFHHEKWDGSGYPKGTKGEDIPLSARIVTIADVFDALTSSRSYKDAWSVDEALSYLIQQSDIHFDRMLVNLFVKQKKNILHIKSCFPE